MDKTNQTQQVDNKLNIQKGVLRNIPISVKKLNVILEIFRGQEVYTALDKLALMPKKGAFYTRKLLKSVIANVENNRKMSAKGMKILKLYATKGQYYKRYRFGAKGRIKPYKKYHANIFIEIGYES